MVWLIHKRGFTLLEIMIVVGVMGLITLGGLASYRRFSEKQQVVQAAEDFVTQLRIVQKNADAGVLATCTDSLLGYRVSVNAAGDNFASVEPICSWSGTADNIILKNNCTFETAATFEFLSLGGGTNSASVALQVESSGVSWCVPLSIGEGGAMVLGDVCEYGSCP